MEKRLSINSCQLETQSYIVIYIYNIYWNLAIQRVDTVNSCEEMTDKKNIYDNKTKIKVTRQR